MTIAHQSDKNSSQLTFNHKSNCT